MIILACLGFVSCLFQLVLLREFTFSIAKNEISLVLAIGLWIVFASLGNLASLKRKQIPLSWLPFLFTCFFCLNIAGIHLSKIFFGVHYFENASLALTIVCAVLFIGTQSFIGGYAFGLLCKDTLKEHPKAVRTSSQLFTFDALGFFIGSLAFSFLWSRYTNPFLFAGLSGILISLVQPRKQKILHLFLIFLVSAVFISLFEPILRIELDHAHIISIEGTPYGPDMVTQKNGTFYHYAQGSLIQTSEDQASHEELIHTAFASTDNHNQVLWIGRFLAAQHREIIKQAPKNFHAVWLTQHPRSMVHIIDDPRQYLRANQNHYDLIISRTPTPDSLSANRFYTLEFFRLVHDHLESDGIFVFSLPSKRDIISPAIADFNSSILNTLTQVFPFVLPVPGDTMIVIASKQEPVDPNRMIQRFKDQEINTTFFTPYHLVDALRSDRKDFFLSHLDPHIALNKDLEPFGFLYYWILEQKKFYPWFQCDLRRAQHQLPIALILFTLFIAGSTLLFKKNWPVLHASLFGFFSIGATTLVYLIFQMMSGDLYWKLGLLISTFMLGLSVTTYALSLQIKRSLNHQLMIKGLYLGWMLIMLALWAVTQLFYKNILGPNMLYILSFLAGALTGSGYPALVTALGQTREEAHNIPVLINIADLIGACIGTICFSIFMVPLLGVPQSLLLTMVLISILGIRNFWR